MRDLEGYIPQISKDEVGLGAICGKYGIRDQGKERCAIKECRTLHFAGALVILTAGGITNIGHRCGRKYFPDQWAAMEGEFGAVAKKDREATKLANAKEQARLVLERLAEFDARLKKHYALLQAFEKHVPKAIIDEVHRRAQKNAAAITVAVRLTGDELEIARTTNDPSAKAGVTEKVIGELGGLAIFRSGNDPWRLAEYVVRPSCQKLLAFGGENAVVLNRLVATVSRAHNEIDQIESGLSQSEQFFSDKNLANLTKLPNARNVRFRAIGISHLGELWVDRG